MPAFKEAAVPFGTFLDSFPSALYLGAHLLFLTLTSGGPQPVLQLIA
jgi:hypothetical protein